MIGRSFERRKRKSFLVLCAWCGSKIREDKQEDATGVCLKCFYQILSNHLHAQKRTSYGEFVSDR
jgi:DNA-directed RNA polymerase subunit RPC12/RpoP